MMTVGEKMAKAYNDTVKDKATNGTPNYQTLADPNNKAYRVLGANYQDRMKAAWGRNETLRK